MPASFKCLFCDHATCSVEATDFSAWENYPVAFAVKCTRCKARGPEKPTEREALAAWGESGGAR